MGYLCHDEEREGKLVQSVANNSYLNVFYRTAACQF